MCASNYQQKKTSFRFRLSQWTICLLVSGTVALQYFNIGQAVAQESDGMGEACFGEFDLTGGDKSVNSYLMLTSSYFIYPAEIGVEELSVETEAFQDPFEERMEHFGMSQFFYFHEESPFEMADFLEAEDEIHHSDCVVMANDAAIIVVCRGSLSITTNPTNWVTNFSFRSEEVTQHFESEIEDGSEVWCHAGFWTAADSVYSRIANCVSFLKAENNRPVYLTGHSLGGALATILSMRLYADGILPKEIFTFAAPRVGDSGFADMFAFSGVNHHRWMNPGDPGPMLPPKAIGFRHTGLLYMTHRVFSSGSKAHSCLEYAKGIWPNLSESARKAVPRWFESDWEWVSPEDDQGSGETGTADQNLSDPRQVDFTHNEYDPYYYLGEDNLKLQLKHDLNQPADKSTDSLRKETQKSPEELEKEIDELLYRYEK